MHGGKRLKTIHEVFRGIKDLKILGREKKFLDIFDFHTDRHVHLIRNEKITQLLPRYSLELVFVFSLFVLHIPLFHSILVVFLYEVSP